MTKKCNILASSYIKIGSAPPGFGADNQKRAWMDMIDMIPGACFRAQTFPALEERYRKMEQT